MFVFRKILKFLLEGRLIKRTREIIDEALGVFTRWIYCYTQKSVPNKIFFHTQEDKYTCNPKYICEEFRRRGVDVDMVWRIRKGKRGEIPEDCRVVNGGSFEFYKELFTSKFVITNSVLNVKKPFTLRKDQIVFETWHGSLGFKRFGKDDYKSNWRWVKGAIKTGKLTDYCITNSSFVSEQLRKTYWPDTPMLEYGHPRNDIMFDTYKEKRKELRKAFLETYELPEDTKFIMYGPTFRDSHDFSVYAIDPEATLAACRERFGGNWKLLLRYHSAVWGDYKKRNKIIGEDIIPVTDYPDMQELITIADIAVTDYSSWILDFFLQRKPGFIFAMDIDAYNNERGLCYKLEEAPFPIATTAEELVMNIRTFDEKKYLNDVEEFLKGKGCVEDGHASERVVDKILEIMNDTKK